MATKIILFIRTKEHLQKDTEATEQMKEAHTRTIGGYEHNTLVTSIHRWLPENEKKAKLTVETFVKQNNLKLVIYDRYRFLDNVRALFKGIKSTPTVILGKHIFTTNITLEQLQKGL